MKKNELIIALERNYAAFIKYIDSLSIEAYNYSVEGKWSASLHLSHLILSVQPLTYVFELNKTAIAEKFGSTTKRRRSYEEMKTFYFEKLKDGGKAPDRFVPDSETVRPQTVLSEKLRSLVNQLGISIEKFSEDELDTLCIPHPLLGSLSLREMLYNAIYHAEHHQNLIIKMLNDKLDNTN
ncbi:DinB family protein [Maribacter sp. 2308TA10-17]|uniref:DinB family protein n=1 Tax=Maribacter sp. 2308TA10-17 TaxID=3386276 RepID=UPI0039BD41F3